MSSLKCLIIDDEFIARKLLSDYVSKVPEFELVAALSSALDATTYINSGEIDVLFLDIQMQDISGLDFLKTLTNKPTTVLTSAYSEYALESYELGVIDYLMKPIDFDRFYQAALKIITQKTDIRTSSIQQQDLSPKVESLFVKADHKIVKVTFNEIMLINGKGPYVQFVMTNNKKITSLQSLSKLDEILPNQFYRTHRSHIVNINHINSIDGNTIFLKDHKAILSKNKRDDFLQLIDKFKLLGD